MADKDFQVTMVDPDGGEFVAGSPEVVARLTAQGYRQKPGEAAAEADEQEAAAAAVDGESKPDGDAPRIENPKPADSGTAAPAPKSGVKGGTDAGKPSSTK